jgi:cyclohexa-1,5-dienecarbonyl-CoA hydratase
MKQYSNLVVSSEEHVAKIIINRPPFNILDIETMYEIAVALEEINKLKDISCVVITGAGTKAFSAGVDVGDHSKEAVIKMLDSFGAMINGIIDSDKVIIAAVNGVALGGGMEVVLACDLALAVESAQLGQPEITLGVFAGFANVVLPRVIARKKALEMILLGESITASTALDLGLINWVSAADEFESKLNEIIKKMSRMSASSLRWCKHSVYATIDQDIKSAMKSIDEIYLEKLMSTFDANEGVRSFLEKRKPVWRHE